LWVADFTYCRTESGWAYTAFVIDVFARKIVGWKVASEMTVNRVTDAINNAIDNRKRCGVVDLTKLIHHSDYAGVCVKPRIGESCCAGWGG
jgi:putative transposase